MISNFISKLLEALLTTIRVQTDNKAKTYLNPDDPRTINVATYTDITTLPEKQINDISKVPVQNQRKIGSCVGQAIGGEDDYYRKGGSEIVESSKRYIYAECKKVDGLSGEGTYPLLAYKLSQKKGIARADVVPNDNTLSHLAFITIDNEINADISAYQFRVNGFAQVDPDPYFIMKKISENRVVGCTLDVDTKAFRVKADGKLAPFKKAGGTRHRMYIYGYEKEGEDIRFYLRNSWDTKWGNNGNGSFLWDQGWSEHIHDLTVMDSIPQPLIEEAKAKRYIFTKKLQYGDKGPEVIELQKRLEAEGYYKYPFATGFFLTKTASALLAWQIDNKIDTKDNLLSLKGHYFGPKSILVMNKKDYPPDNINYGDLEPLVRALIMVESGGDDGAIGDKNLPDMAFGPLQIRKPYLDDINRVYKTEYTVGEMVDNRQLSIDMFYKYMSIYCTEKRLNRPPRYEDYARIHNGGPNGYKNMSTIAYWNKVKSHL